MADNLMECPICGEKRGNIMENVNLSPESIKYVLNYLSALNAINIPEAHYVDVKGNVIIKTKKLSFKVCPEIDSKTGEALRKINMIQVDNGEYYSEIKEAEANIADEYDDNFDNRYYRLFKMLIDRLYLFIEPDQNPLTVDIEEVCNTGKNG